MIEPKEQLFERNLLRAFRKRCAKNFAQHNFLHHEVANRIHENLFCLPIDSNKTFEKILELGAWDTYLSDLINAKQKFTTDAINHSDSFNLVADDEFLPFKEQSFDLILSNLNLHFINQIPQFLLQVKNLLKPDGIFIASFFGEENLHELANILQKTEDDIYGGVSPRMPPTIDVKTAAQLLAKAGFGNSVSDLEKIEIEYSNPQHLLQDLKNMAQSNVLNKRSRRFFTKNFLQKLCQNYQKNYQNRKVLATFEIITVSGFKK
jgi:SAM-dependent methyltransferase